jgi:DNA-binding NarL/FixJ family response regulator
MAAISNQPRRENPCWQASPEAAAETVGAKPMTRRLTATRKWSSLKPMSKQRPSSEVHGTKSAVVVGIKNFWSKRLFKNTYTRGGRRMQVDDWAIKIQHLGRRRTFSLGTPDKDAAAVEAKAIYETIVAEGWDAALNHKKKPGGFSKTDARYWKEQLLLRRYRFPASGEPEKSYVARIGHADNAYFFPLGTAETDEAAQMACRIYCSAVKEGWEATGKLFPRELIVAFEWSANPIMWTYTTVHTLVGRLARVETARVPARADLPRVLIVETDAGLRRALTWCINHQPGFCAIACESPETFASAFAAHKPGLVLLNRSLAERMGIGFSGGLAALPNGALALAYSVSVDGDHMFVSTPGGAEGYMLKRVNPVNLLDPMLQTGILSGKPADDYLAPVKLFFKGLLRPLSGRHTDALARLTPRENEVLLLLSKGGVDKEIAQAMGISVWTVHGHIKKIFERLGVRTRTEAVVHYLEK